MFQPPTQCCQIWKHSELTCCSSFYILENIHPNKAEALNMHLYCLSYCCEVNLQRSHCKFHLWKVEFWSRFYILQLWVMLWREVCVHLKINIHDVFGSLAQQSISWQLNTFLDTQMEQHLVSFIFHHHGKLLIRIFFLSPLSSSWETKSAVNQAQKWKLFYMTT